MKAVSPTDMGPGASEAVETEPIAASVESPPRASERDVDRASKKCKWKSPEDRAEIRAEPLEAPKNRGSKPGLRSNAKRRSPHDAETTL